MTREPVGKPPGGEGIDALTLKNDAGMEVEAITVIDYIATEYRTRTVFAFSVAP